jgi:predicted metal-dependent HD superfamily phosphohydrolase
VPSDDLELRIAWQQHVGRGPVADRWLASVIARHHEPGRHYHTVRHVRWVVRHVISFADRLHDLGAVVAAASFHDVVYDARASDNEAASARLAAVALAELGWPADRIDRVTSLILATTEHLVPGDDLDHDVLLAADLAVLAAEPGRYGDYVRAVRREYGHIDDGAWQVGRAAMLRRFLTRHHLFSPRLALDDWERRARANIAAELADLESR